MQQKKMKTRRELPATGFYKKRLSPVSPFQFGSYDNQLASPSSNSTVSSLETRLGLEGDDPCYASSPSGFSSSVFDTATFSNLLQTQQRLRDSMNQARQLGRSIDRTDLKFEKSFSRLPFLELAAVSICSHSKLDKALSSRIDVAMAPTSKLLRALDLLHHLESAVAAASTGDVGRYLENVRRFETCLSFIRDNFPKALQILKQTVEFVQRTKLLDSFHVLKLNETLMVLKSLQLGQEHTRLHEELLDEAFEHLAREFRRILTEYGAPISLQDAKIHDFPCVPPLPLPAPVVQILQEMAGTLAAHGRLNICLKTYEEIRSRKAGQSLQTLHPDYLQYATPEAVDKLDWGVLEDHITQWTQHIQIFVRVLLDSESRLCQQIFSSVHSCSWTECFSNVAMSAGLASFVMFGEAVVKSQKEPHKLFKMLELLDILQKLKPDIERIFEDPGCKLVKEQMKELQKKTVLGACRVFWEFGLQVEMAEGSMPSEGSVLRMASYGVNYIKYLITDFYGTIMSDVLKIAQGWRGDSMERKKSELPIAILDIMESLERNIESRAKMSDDPALANLFLMNNHRYIHARSVGTDLGSLLGDAWLKHHERKMEQHALEYQKAAWGSAVLRLSEKEINLSSSSKLKSSRELLTQRIERFQVAFDGVYQRHRSWSIPDNELREQMGLAVLQFMVEAYRNYLNKFGSLLQLGTPLQFKYSPEDIEQKLTTLFYQDLAVKKSFYGAKDMQMFYST